MITSFFIYLLKACICMGLFYGFYHLVLRKENFFELNRGYLVGSVLLSLLIPYFQVTLTTVKDSAATIYLGLDELVVEEISSVIAVEEASTWGFDKLLLVIYLVGVAALLLKMLISLSYILHLRMWNRVERKDGYIIVKITQNHPVFSFLNMIFWSEQLDYTEEEKQQILLHELVHIQQRHSLDILFFELINMLFWFNPLMYLYKQSLKNTHEFIADYHLYQKHRFQIRYVDLLMKEAKTQRANSLPVVHTFFNNQLKKRLIMISNTNKPSSKFKLLACLPIVAMLIITFSCNKEVLNVSSGYDNVSMDKATPGSIYQACDLDENGMITLEDGKKVTVDEMKNIIVQRRAAEGDVVKKSQVFIISKEEMARGLKGPQTYAQPELGDCRVVLVANGKVMIMEELAPKKLGPILPIQSFDVVLQKPIGEKNGITSYETMTLNLEGNKLNDTCMRFIDSVTEKEKSHIILKNIVVTKDGQEYIKKEATKMDLTLFK